METLHNGFTLDIPPGCFPLGTDSMALAHFVRLKKDAKILDLGSGCGTLGLMLCATDPGCSVTGVELDPIAHRGALENIRHNGLEDRMKSICADLRCIPGTTEPGQYSCCVSNPPYFSGGPVSQELPLARREDCCTMEDLFRSAAWSLRYGGDFYLVHRPERLAELCAQAVRHGLEPKRLRLLRHRPRDPVSLILVSCRKGGKPGLIWEEICLYDETGAPTQAHREIYHNIM